MTELSPAAQAVLDAFNAEARPEPHHQREAIAAALRAASALEGIKPEPLGPCDEWYGNPMRTERISQQDFRYSLAKERKKTQIVAQRQLLAIAAELGGTQSLSGTH